MKLAATLLALALATTHGLLAEGGHDVQKKNDAPKGLRGNAAKADSSLERAAVGRKLDFGYSDEPTTDPRACKDETGGKGPYPPGCWNTNEIGPWQGKNVSGTCNATGTRHMRMLWLTAGVDGGTIVADCSPTGANCTVCGPRADEDTGLIRLMGCCNDEP